MNIAEKLREKADEVNFKLEELKLKRLYAKIIADCDKAADIGRYELSLISKEGYSELYSANEEQTYTLLEDLTKLLAKDGLKLTAPVDVDSPSFSPSNTDYRVSWRKKQ